MTGAGPVDVVRRFPPHTAGGDGASVEPGPCSLHDLRVVVGTVLRFGRPGPGADRRRRASTLRDLCGVSAPAGWRAVHHLLRVRVPAVSELRRKTPLRAKTQLRRRTELRRTSSRVYSARRLAELPAEWARRREAVRLAGERDGWRCQAEDVVLSVACDGGLEGHEPLMRSRGGDPLDEDQIVTTCAAHHRWAHAHPKEAGQLGLLRHSWEGPIQR